MLDVPRGKREQISRDVRLSPEETKFIDADYQSHRRTIDTDLLAINHAVGTPWQTHGMDQNIKTSTMG